MRWLRKLLEKSRRKVAAPNAPTDEQLFQARYIRELKSRAQQLEIRTVEPLHLEISQPGGEPVQIFLNNAHDQLKAEPGQLKAEPGALEALIHGHVSAALETLGSLTACLDVSRIVPVVKDRGWLEDMSRAAATADASTHEYVYHALNASLVIVYAEDSPNSIRYLDRTAFEAAGLDTEDYGPRALRNLQQLLPAIEVENAGELLMLVAGGSYEASLLLFDWLWDGNGLEVHGDIVAAIPARDLLLITGSKDVQGMRQLREIAANAFDESPYHLTRDLFVRRDGQWLEFPG